MNWQKYHCGSGVYKKHLIVKNEEYAFACTGKPVANPLLLAEVNTPSRKELEGGIDVCRKCANLWKNPVEHLLTLRLSPADLAEFEKIAKSQGFPSFDDFAISRVYSEVNKYTAE